MNRVTMRDIRTISLFGTRAFPVLYIRSHLVSDLLHLHIFQSTYTFPVSLFSDAVPSINPKILSFIISDRGERGRMKISRERSDD